MKQFFTNLFKGKLSVPAKVTFIAMGIASTVWFLIRVVPKPQRAGYPCMRTAAPIMSSFVIYLLSLGGSVLLFRKAFASFRRAKFISAIVSFVLCIVLVAIFNLNDVKDIYANVLGITFEKGVLPDAPNTPMGSAWGIFPGRVAWTYSPNATNENCTNSNSDSYLLPKNSNQDTINKLANKALMLIGGKSTVKDSWDAIFKSFNKRKTGTEAGYATGQKIFIKINNGQAGWAISRDGNLAETAQGTSAMGVGNFMANTSPQAVAAFLYQLVDSCGIAPENIMIGEPMTHVYKSMRDVIQLMPAKYAAVKLMDKEVYTKVGRTTSAGWVSDVIKWSDKGKVMTSAVKDDMMKEMYEADYIINIAALKAHARGGVTLTAKNNFGSSTHGKSYSAERLHTGLVSIKDNDKMAATDYPRTDYGMYRVLTDLMGHEKLGRNTVLFIVDGLWSGIEATDMPIKWDIAPFNGDWPSSLFVAQDEIALQSVCLDFLRAEAENNAAFKDRPFFPGIDDFLHQGATKANWPDSIQATGNKTTAKWYAFAGYDPEGDGTLMPSSLGVHEHWNNATDKEYTRNLFSNGTGIELVSYPAKLVLNKNQTSYKLTVTVKEGTTPVADARVIVNGSAYLTDDQGIAVIGSLPSTTGLNYTIKKKGYSDITGSVDITADAQVTKAIETGSNPSTNVLANTLKATLSAYPNPCTTDCQISYQLKTSANVSLFIIASDGKIVKQIQQALVVAGNYNLKVSTQDLNKGMYICVLKAQYNGQNEVKSLKLLVK